MPSITFSRSKCARHRVLDPGTVLLPLFRFVGDPLKEISESKCVAPGPRTLAAVPMLLYRLPVPLKRSDANVVVYCIGDGTTPRTAAIIARETAYTVYAIDPLMNLDFKDFTPRCTAVRSKAEDFQGLHLQASLSIVVAVHSHACLSDFWARLPEPKLAIARIKDPVLRTCLVACCKKQIVLRC